LAPQPALENCLSREGSRREIVEAISGNLLVKAASCTASVPLCRRSWSRPGPATGLFSLTVYVFLMRQMMVLNLSIQPSCHSSTLDITFAGQGDGAISGLTTGHSGEVLQEPLLDVCRPEGVQKLH